MRLCALTILLLLLASCDDPRSVPLIPTASDVSRLEAELALDECIGDLLPWERRYEFWSDLDRRSPSFGKINPEQIEFRLRRGTAAEPIEPILSRLPVGSGFRGEIDDRPGYSAGGRFDTKSGKLVVEYCEYSQGG